jgi:carbon-monoxide dehydrogenase medium subunit
MKPVTLDIKQAGSLAEAAELLAAVNGDGKILAGGQSLVPMLNLRLARPRLLVNIRRACDFKQVVADNKVFSIGAGWTHAEIEDGIVEDPTQGLLRFVARGIAYRAVRNRGTIAGSLAHADPAADWVSTLSALGASILVQGPGAKGPQRRLAAETFVEGAFVTRLSESEVITAIEIPRLSANAEWAYYKICRKTGEFASAIGVVILDKKLGVSRVLVGATDGPPALLPKTAAKLAESGTEAAGKLVAEEIDEALPHQDVDARALHAVAIRRALGRLGKE